MHALGPSGGRIVRKRTQRATEDAASVRSAAWRHAEMHNASAPEPVGPYLLGRREIHRVGQQKTTKGYPVDCRQVGRT